uniref:Uncharacterized protein n=1 Tax=Romanomermis culicivorax TaxID=13658 RepID=A0A915JK74_ROMCU
MNFVAAVCFLCIRCFQIEKWLKSGLSSGSFTQSVYIRLPPSIKLLYFERCDQSSVKANAIQQPMNVIKVPTHRRKCKKRMTSTSQLPQSIMCRLDANANPMLQRYLIDVNNAMQQRGGKMTSEGMESPAFFNETLSKKHRDDHATNHHHHANQTPPGKSKPHQSTSKKKLIDPSVVLFGKSRFAHRVGIFAKTYKCSDTVANLATDLPCPATTRKRAFPNEDDFETNEHDFDAILASSKKQSTFLRKETDDFVAQQQSPTIKNRNYQYTNSGRFGLNHANRHDVQAFEPPLTKWDQRPTCSKNNRSPGVNTVSEWSAGLTPENKPSSVNKEALPTVNVEEIDIPDKVVERIVSILPLWRTRTGLSITKRISRHLYTKMLQTNPELLRQSKDFGTNTLTKHMQGINSRSRNSTSAHFCVEPRQVLPQPSFFNLIGDNDDQSDEFHLVGPDFMAQYQEENQTFRPIDTTLNTDDDFQLNLDAIVGNIVIPGV